MVMERAEAALRATKDPKDTERANIIKTMLEARGEDIALTQVAATRNRSSRSETPVAVELNLDAEWQRQGQNFLKLGFHTETGYEDTDKGKQAYLDSLPKFEPQPKEYRGKFDKPLLVEKRISWEKQAELAGIAISDYLRSNLDKTKRWGGSHSNAPEDKSYTGWFNNWGQRFVDKIRPIDARDQLTTDEVGGDPFEGVAQEIHHPEDNANGRYFDLIDYKAGSDGVVYLRRWRGRPELHASLGGIAHDGWRPLVRGSKIVTRKLAD